MNPFFEQGYAEVQEGLTSLQETINEGIYVNLAEWFARCEDCFAYEIKAIVERGHTWKEGMAEHHFLYMCGRISAERDFKSKQY